MIAARLPQDADFAAWRQAARTFLSAGVAPDRIDWTGEPLDLFGQETFAGSERGLTVPRTFSELGEKVALNRDGERFDLLYRLVWRLQDNRRLLEDFADPEVARLHELARGVRRDIHKMHAFVRFKEVADERGACFVAWFEPQHYILRAAADFFVKRFTAMRWSIVTPSASAHWDGTALDFGPGGHRGDVPAEDARDEDWRVFYASMFNPARLSTRAMRREMPRRYWADLPEASRIPALVRDAPARAEEMIVSSPSLPRKRAGAAAARMAPEALPASLQPVAAMQAPPSSLDALKVALASCSACPLAREATQATPGEGSAGGPLLALVGEQPGDHEDLAGRPFVGPAGRLLDQALETAGLSRADLYVTNAVKHFKYEPRGRLRLHKRADRNEIEACRWWLRHELALVKPRLVVALGATALRSLSSYDGPLGSVRGQSLRTREGAPLVATTHPSALLRTPDPAARRAGFDRFVAELRAADVAARDLPEPMPEDQAG